VHFHGELTIVRSRRRSLARVNRDSSLVDDLRAVDVHGLRRASAVQQLLGAEPGLRIGPAAEELNPISGDTAFSRHLTASHEPRSSWRWDVGKSSGRRAWV
jgi:hypothetical protein